MSHHQRDPAPKSAPYPYGKGGGKGARRPARADPMAIMPAEAPPLPVGQFEDAIPPESRVTHAIERREFDDGNNRALETIERTDERMMDTTGQASINVTNIHTLTQQAFMDGVDSEEAT